MKTLELIRKPSKSEQKIAFESYNTLSAIIDQINKLIIQYSFYS